MKDTCNTSELSWTVPMEMDGRPRGTWDDEARQQPLCSLYQYNMIMSPSHEDEEEGRSAPVVGEILDFDDHVIEEESNYVEKSPRHHVSGGSLSSGDELDSKKVASKTSHDNETGDNDDSVDGSILDLAMFEGVLQDDGVISEEDLAPLPAVIACTMKRPVEHEKVSPVKKPKTRLAPKVLAAPAADTPVANATKPEAEVVVDEPKKLPATPARRRPNCLFINHFGTRLDETGRAVKVNVPVTQYSPARISSEESVSVKSKVTASTGRSSKNSFDTYSKKTPVKNGTETLPFDMTSPSAIPSVVRIVTPNKKKEIKSSCLEDITMEEDELEPIKHDVAEVDGEDLMMGGHIPYMHSAGENSLHTPALASMNNLGAHMMHGMMTAGMSVNFNRPFPLLQRRAFLTGCHPMAGHPVASFANPGWHPAFAGQGMHFNPQVFAGSPHAPPSANPTTAPTRKKGQRQWKKK